CNHDCPFWPPSDTTRKSAPLILMLLMMSSRLISSTEPNPGKSEPTQHSPVWQSLIAREAAAATPSGPPNRNIFRGRGVPCSVLSASRISAPAIRSRMGTPVSHAIHIIGIPSAEQRSLRINDPLKDASDWLVTRKLRFGVEMRKGQRAVAADLIR